ncbi:MAG: DMT family transporter, partial [Clostridia bacterium]
VLTKMNNYDLTIVQFIVCGILFCVYFLCVDVPQGVLASIDWNKFILPVIFMAVFGTAFAYGSQTFAQMHISPSEVALILSFESVLGAFFSILMGLDQLHWSIIVGGALMFASILIVEVLPEIIEKRKRNKLVAEEAKEVAEYNKEIIEQTKEIDDKELKKR